MAKEVENQGIINMTDRQVFDELINLHAKAAGESLSSIPSRSSERVRMQDLTLHSEKR